MVVLEDLVEEDLLVMELHVQAELVILLAQVHHKEIMEVLVLVLLVQVEQEAVVEQLRLE
jgi:hypothetical protein